MKKKKIRTKSNFRRTFEQSFQKNTENSIDLISGHLLQYFNNEEIIVFHETESERFHLDIYVVMANRQRPYHLLMTCGMSSQPMNVPKGYDHLKYCELVTLIPSSFSLDLATMKEEEYTPIKILQDSYNMTNLKPFANRLQNG
ncbi:MAG: suppressor of fused domain protein [Candidatus Shapirobacteria bacterium]|jgi:hypothetical protein|nr:suppressor of fused domain protein [Bacteroidales bacterium]MDD4106719.1 suppressor of fused domain protein [Candidatus Shapirobacteria bacterium]